MSQLIVRILRLDPPYYDVPNTPDKTLHIDATAAGNLGMTELEQVGEVTDITFIVGSKSVKMDAVLLSLEFPSGNIIRLTANALKQFGLKSGLYYWVRWEPDTETLRILRKVNGK